MDQAKSNEEIHIPMAERLKGIPGTFGIRLGEEPPYTVVDKEGDIEIRHYEPQIWAQTTVQGDRKEAEETAFKRLAAYIFGKNKSETVSEMTVPVMQEHSAAGLTMSFILSKDESGRTAPLPEDHAVILKTVPERHVAALRYTMKTDDGLTREKTTELMKWLSNHPKYKVASEPMSAQYDDPHAIPFLRRNEIHVDVLVLAFV